MNFRIRLVLIAALLLIPSSAQAAEMSLGPQGQLIVDGKPTILLGVWQQPPNLFHYQASLGINCLVVPPMDVGRRSSAGEYLRKAHGEGLSVILARYDEALKNEPNLWGWDVGILGTRSSRDLIGNSRRVKAADPDRLRVANIHALLMLKNRSNDAALRAGLAEVDAVVSHVWPEMFPGEPRDLRLVGEFVKLVRHLSADRPGGEVSIWPDINPHGWRGKDRVEYPAPTPAELRFQIWLSLIHGADGICFFPISFEPFVYSQIPAENEKEMIFSSRLINRLAPVLTAAPSPLKVTITARDEAAILDIATRRHDCADYIFLLNGQNTAQQITLTLEGLGADYRLEDLLPDEPAAVLIAKPGEHTERLAPLALRIWRIVPAAAPAAE
jgi:hypothetical protein